MNNTVVILSEVRTRSVRPQSRDLGLARVAVVFAALFMLAGAATPLTAQRESLRNADSIMLQRTECYGSCPVYTLTITRSDTAHWKPRAGQSTERAITAGSLALLMSRADSINLIGFPMGIENDAKLCPSWFTDASHVIITVFQPGRVRSVDDYFGCKGGRDLTGAMAGGVPVATFRPIPALEPLRDFQRLIDSVAGTSTWLATVPCANRVNAMMISRACR